MTFRRALCGILALAVLPSGASAAKFAGEFMAIGPGARALGMGGAFCAVAADVSTIYWNPAGLSGMQKREVLLMHAERFGDLVNYNFASYGQPTRLVSEEREAAWGLGLMHLGIDDIPVTAQIPYEDVNDNGVFDPENGDYLVDQNGNRFTDYSSIPMESDNSFAFLGSFALKTGFGRVGGNLKLIYSDAIAGNTSTGIGIDLGWLYQDAFVPRLNFGAKLQDATGTYISWSTGYNEFITPMLKLGTSYKIVSDGFNGALILAVDSDIYFDNRQQASEYWVETVSADIHTGAEVQFQEVVFVRGGFDSNWDNYTAGAGVRVSFLEFDYAYLHHDDFEATHRVSVLAAW